MGQLEGKVCIITGGGTGIGKGIARAFAKEGATLVLAARQLDRLNDSAEEMRGYGAPTNVVQTDVTSEEQVKKLFETTMTDYGKLDILVNNSGVFDGGPLEEISLETWMKVMNVNLTGVFLCTREAMRIMKPQRSGRIINIGSISSNMPRMNSAPYATSKHGIIGLTKSTALEGREYGISASAIHPGVVAVEWNESRDEQARMSTDDLASVALAMAVLPPDVNMLEATILPVQQPYLGRG